VPYYLLLKRFRNSFTEFGFFIISTAGATGVSDNSIFGEPKDIELYFFTSFKNSFPSSVKNQQREGIFCLPSRNIKKSKPYSLISLFAIFIYFGQEQFLESKRKALTSFWESVNCLTFLAAPVMVQSWAVFSESQG